jgi:hypothetical protein
MQIKKRISSLSGTTLRKRSVGKKIASAVAVAALVLTPIFAVIKIERPSQALAGTKYLGGMEDGSDLLRIAVNDDGGTNPQRFNPNGDCSYTPGSTGSCWTKEYYADNGNGLVLYADGKVLFWGGNGFLNFGDKSEDVDISVSNSAFFGNTEKINRTWTGTGDAAGIVLQETISLVRGAQEYVRTVTIVNNTNAELSDVRLIVGGDTYFAGDDYGYTGYEANSKTVYVFKDNEHGAMFFSGSATTPADKYFAGHFSTGAYYAKDEADLPNTVSGSTDEVDTGYYLQWGNGSQNIAEDGQLTISMSESITNETTTNVQIASPSNRAANVNSTETFNFTILSLGVDQLSLANITATSAHGWGVTVSPDSGALNFGEILNVVATVTIPSDVESNTVDTITLSVPLSGLGTETATVQLIVDPQPATITSVSPSAGTAAGGNNITITGTNFNDLLTVLVGGNQAEIVSVTPTTLTVKAPAHEAGLVDVVIDGEFVDSVVATNAYEYVSYGFIAGGSEHQLGANDDLTFRISRDAEAVESITIAGYELTSEEIEFVVTGDVTSTVIVLPAGFLNELGVGTYTIEVAYADGFALSDNFTISSAPTVADDEPDVPNTGAIKGDTSKVALFSVLPVAVIALVIFVVAYRVIEIKSKRVKFSKK